MKPGQKTRLFASGQHAGQVVDRCVGIAAPHRFDEGRDHVVVLFAVLVVEGDVLLQTVGDVLVGDRYFAVCGARDDVQNVEQLAGVAARKAEQRFGFLYLDLPGFELRIGGEGPVEEGL